MRTAEEIISSLKRHGWEQIHGTIFCSGNLVKVVLPNGRTVEGFSNYEHDEKDIIPVQGCECLRCNYARQAKI